MKKFLSIVLSVALAGANVAIAQTVARSAITFKIKNMGIGTDGTISGLQANAHFNPQDLQSSAIEASVDVNTINTDNSSRDEHLKGEDFFDVARYPKIIIKSVSFKHKNGNNYTGLFNLTIKNKTKEVEMPFTYIEKNNRASFTASLKLNRLDYGIGGTSLVLADEAIVNIEAEVVK